MACSRYFVQALAHSNISSRKLSIRGLQTSQSASRSGSAEKRLEDNTQPGRIVSSRSQFLQDMALLYDIETASSDKGSDTESKGHIASSPPRLDPPMAFDSPEYTGHILPFPDKLAPQTSEIQSTPPIRFTRTETMSEYWERIANAKAFQDREDKIASENAEANMPVHSRDHFGTKFTVRTMASGEPDLFLAKSTVTDKSTPVICEDVQSIRALRHKATKHKITVGFVPTMGALHRGHLDLMRAAAERCDEVWVSIYVNPTQFGANEDLSTYPSTWKADLDKIERLNEQLLSTGQSRITTIFKPRNAEVLYPYGVEGTSHVIINPELTQILEGSSRPTFFRGVTTIVMKLLNIVQPDRTFFGQKDIQQFMVIKRMIKEFHLPVVLERVATTRERSGLAMSSRNAYLGRRRQEVAPLLYKMLSAAKEAFHSVPSHLRTRSLLVGSAMKVYTAEVDKQTSNTVTNPQHAVQFKLDYLSLAEPDTMKEIRDKVGPRGAVMSLAILFQPLAKESITSQEKLGINGDQTAVRLIDNELLGVSRVVQARNEYAKGFAAGLRVQNRHHIYKASPTRYTTRYRPNSLS